MAAAKGWAVQFDIARSMYMGVLDEDTVEERARRRARLRRHGRSVWRQAKANGAHRVDRFVMVVMVAGTGEPPMLAVETLKPLVDAGTDVGLWPDDDPFHRVLTLYARDPNWCPRGRVRVSVAVIPLDPLDGAPGCMLRLTPGARAALVELSVPDRSWLTSNMRLPVRQRQARQNRVMRQAAPLWRDKSLPGQVGLLAGVRYPDARREWVGDPDNVAETLTAAWGAGAMLGMVPREPVFTGFYLLDGQAAAHEHDIAMLAYTLPDRFDLLGGLLGQGA